MWVSTHSKANAKLGILSTKPAEVLYVRAREASLLIVHPTVGGEWSFGPKHVGRHGVAVL